MKQSKHKRLFIGGGIIVLIILLADLASTSLGTSTWRGSTAYLNMRKMIKLMNRIYDYREMCKTFPDSLYDLPRASLGSEKDLSDWIDREASANMILWNWIEKTFLARRHIYLYFPPQKTASGYKNEPEAIILAEPYSQFGKRYVYRQKDLIELSPDPKLLEEAEFQRQTQNLKAQ